MRSWSFRGIIEHLVIHSIIPDYPPSCQALKFYVHVVLLLPLLLLLSNFLSLSPSLLAVCIPCRQKQLVCSVHDNFAVRTNFYSVHDNKLNSGILMVFSPLHIGRVWQLIPSPTLLVRVESEVSTAFLFSVQY